MQATLDYLFLDMVGRAESLAAVHYFMWDRTRAIRNDFSIQQVTDAEPLRIAIESFERIARFHILSLHEFAGDVKPYEQYTAQQEREQLDKTLLSLMHYYEEGRGVVPLPNESEFRSYCIIFQIQDPIPDLLDRVQNWPKEIRRDRRVRLALQIYAAACSILDDQGPLKPKRPHSIAQSNWSRFWHLVESQDVSFLMGCLAEIYFPHIRHMVMDSLKEAYKQSSDETHVWSLSTLQKVLGFDDERKTHEYIASCGFCLGGRNGISYLGDYSSSYEPETPFHPTSSLMVETKRSRRRISAITDGLSIPDSYIHGLIVPEAGLESGLEPESRRHVGPQEPVVVSQSNRRPSSTNHTTLAGDTPLGSGLLGSGSAPLNPSASKFTPYESPLPKKFTPYESPLTWKPTPPESSREPKTLGNQSQGQDRTWQQNSSIKFAAPDPTTLTHSAAADKQKDNGFQNKGASSGLNNQPLHARDSPCNKHNDTEASSAGTPSAGAGSAFTTPNFFGGGPFISMNTPAAAPLSTSSTAEGGAYIPPKPAEGSAFNSSRNTAGSTFGSSLNAGATSSNTSNALGQSSLGTSNILGGNSLNKPKFGGESPFSMSNVLGASRPPTTSNKPGGGPFTLSNVLGADRRTDTSKNGGGSSSTTSNVLGASQSSATNNAGESPFKMPNVLGAGPSAALNTAGASPFKMSNVLGASPPAANDAGASSFDRPNTTTGSPFTLLSQNKSPFAQSTNPSFGKPAFGTANHLDHAGTAGPKDNVGMPHANAAQAGMATGIRSESTSTFQTGLNNFQQSSTVSDTPVDNTGPKHAQSVDNTGLEGASRPQDVSSNSQQYNTVNGAPAFAAAAQVAGFENAGPGNGIPGQKAPVDSRTIGNETEQAAAEGKTLADSGPVSTEPAHTPSVDTESSYTGLSGARGADAKPSSFGVAKTPNFGAFDTDKVDAGASKPKPLDAEATKPANTGLVNTRNVDVDAVSANSFGIQAGATSTPDPQALGASEVKTKEDRIIDELTQKLMLEQNGFLDQFAEYSARPMVEAAIGRIRDGKYGEQAGKSRLSCSPIHFANLSTDEFRLRSLCLRYGQMWREISRRRRRARWGQEQRRRRRERAEERTRRIQETSISARLEAAQKARQAREATKAANVPSTPDRLESKESLAVSSNGLSSRPLSAQQDRQSQTATELLHGTTTTPSRGHPARHQGSLMLRGARSTNSVLRPGRTLNDPNFGQRRDTTRSTYFKLRALGLDPNDNNVFPRKRSVVRDRIENKGEAAVKAKHNPRKRSLDQGTESVVAMQNGTDAERPSKRNATTPPGQINGKPSPKLSPEEEDEVLFAKVREATQAMTESIAYLKEEVKRSSQGSSRRDSGDMARSGMQNHDVHSQTLDQANTATRGGNDASKKETHVSTSRISKTGPKYRTRVSKFLPRDQYADRTMKNMSQSVERQSRTMNGAANSGPSGSPFMNGASATQSVNNFAPSPQPPGVGQNSVATFDTPSQPAQIVKPAQPTQPTKQSSWAQGAMGATSNAPFAATSNAPFSAPSNAPFSATSGAPFSAPSIAPFSAPSATPFSAPSNGPFSASSGAPFSAPFSAPFTESHDAPFDANTAILSGNGVSPDPSLGPNSAPVSPPPQTKPRQASPPPAIDPALPDAPQDSNPFALLGQDEGEDMVDDGYVYGGSDEDTSEGDSAHLNDVGALQDNFDGLEGQYPASGDEDEEDEDSEMDDSDMEDGHMDDSEMEDVEDEEDEDESDPAPFEPRAINGKTGNSADDAIEL